MSRILLLVVASWFSSACDLLSDPDIGSTRTSPIHGMVVGFVRDSAGRGVANAQVCATTVLDVRGTPLILVRHDVTTTNGAYRIAFDLAVETDVRTGLTIAATPTVATGLAPGTRSGLTLLIAATPPPAETTQANVVVLRGEPYDGVFCIHGS